MQRAASATRLVPSLSQVSGSPVTAASTASTNSPDMLLFIYLADISAKNIRHAHCACVVSGPVLHNWFYQASVKVHLSYAVKISCSLLLIQKCSVIKKMLH